VAIIRSQETDPRTPNLLLTHHRIWSNPRTRHQPTFVGRQIWPTIRGRFAAVTDRGELSLEPRYLPMSRDDVWLTQREPVATHPFLVRDAPPIATD